MLHKLIVQLWSWFILTFQINDLRLFLNSLARSLVSLFKFNLPNSVQSLSHVWLFFCPMDTSTPGLSVHHQLLELAQSHVPWVGDAMHPPHPLLSPSPPAFSIFQHRVFSSESVLCISKPNYWSFCISPSNEYSGLISLRIDWSNLLAVQWTLKSLLQYHSSKGAMLCCSTFFPYQVDLKFCALPDSLWTPWGLFQMWAIKEAIDYSSTVLGSSCHVICHLKLAPTSLHTLLSTMP